MTQNNPAPHHITDLQKKVFAIVDEVFLLHGRTKGLSLDTPLIKVFPQIDSMSVVALLTAFEEQLGVAVADDEIDGAIFETMGTLVAFVERKLAP